MICHADVEKLRRMRAPEPAVLSLYLPVPLPESQRHEYDLAAIKAWLAVFLQRYPSGEGWVVGCPVRVPGASYGMSWIASSRRERASVMCCAATPSDR